MIISDKLKEYAAITGSILLTLITFGMYERSRGRQSQQIQTDNAKAEAAVAKADAKQVESRHETDIAVNNLPDAPAQPIATADPATAAGKLRDDGWTRD